ncbi:hypothetical protein AUP68_10622 [Ilyonectria robusta]
MATPWPEEHPWPTPFREHAAKLSRYLQAALKSIDNANGQLIEPRSVRVAFIGALTLVAKLQNIPNLENWMGTSRSSGRGKSRMESWQRSVDRCVSNRMYSLHLCSPFQALLALGTDQYLSVAERSLRHAGGFFPTIAPRASFQGPIDTTTLRFKAGSLSEDQLKCCGFVQCQTYLAPPRDNDPPFKGGSGIPHIGVHAVRSTTMEESDRLDEKLGRRWFCGQKVGVDLTSGLDEDRFFLGGVEAEQPRENINAQATGGPIDDGEVSYRGDSKQRHLAGTNCVAWVFCGSPASGMHPVRRMRRYPSGLAEISKLGKNVATVRYDL